ncbi:MAG: hypothetical protein KAJ19_21250 [Gammaproteobacteria bacterium]|nr:hypothetical protein [Gammaproteobacteria bacterium]
MSSLQTITQGFMRPVETSSTVTAFSVTVAGSPAAVPFRDGVEGCMLTLLSYFKTQYAFASITLEITPEWKVRLTHSVSNLGIVATEATRLFGFTEDIAESSPTITAQQTPMLCWFPTHHSYDGSRWWQDQGERFKGAMGASGGKFGVTLPARYNRNFLYSTNFSQGTYTEAERNTYTISSVDYYPAAERSFQEFMDGANTVGADYPASGNVNPKGCYYIDRAYEYTGSSPTRALPATMDAGGIHISLDDNSKRDNFVFCQIDGDIGRPAQTDPRSAAYYQPAFTLSTDDTPDTVAWIS